MFDSVIVHCRCGREVEFQSKGGPCYLRRYEVHDAPLSVLADIVPDEQCCECGRLVRIGVSFHAFPIICPPEEET